MSPLSELRLINPAVAGTTPGTFAAGDDPRIVSRPLTDGASVGLSLAGHIFDRDAHRPSSVHVMAAPVVPVKVLTVPAGYIAVTANAGAYNTTGANIAAQVYLMADSATVPSASDRFIDGTATANAQTAFVFTSAVDEGGSIWAGGGAVGLNILLDVALIPKANLPGTWTVILRKNLALVDTPLYSVANPGMSSHYINALGHNRTGGSATLTVKLKRAADAGFNTVGGQVLSNLQTAALTVGANTAALNLMQGDALTIAASAGPVNMSLLVCERPIAGTVT